MGSSKWIFLERMTADNPFHSFLPDFPGISSANAEATSPADLSYNCIAHAGGDSGRWWWPDPFGDSFWPPTAKREVTVSAFVDAYRAVGYEPCDADATNSGDEN